MKLPEKNPLTSSSSAAPANHSRLPASGSGWETTVVIWPSSPLELCKRYGLGGSSSKMSPACCHRLADGTLAPSSPRWKTAGMGGPSASSTPSGSVCLSAGDGCSSPVTATLSQVLETGALPHRYFLSEKACRGILRRAAARGRKLPEALRQALEGQAARSSN